jgi:hypothetical protein
MGKIKSIWCFYRDGFKNMTWGRELWWLILLKVVILFAVLRVFFFRPVMSGMNDEQKSQMVGDHLIKNDYTENKDTLNLITD